MASGPINARDLYSDLKIPQRSPSLTPVQIAKQRQQVKARPDDFTTSADNAYRGKIESLLAKWHVPVVNTGGQPISYSQRVLLFQKFYNKLLGQGVIRGRRLGQDSVAGKNTLRALSRRLPNSERVVFAANGEHREDGGSRGLGGAARPLAPAPAPAPAAVADQPPPAPVVAAPASAPAPAAVADTGDAQQAKGDGSAAMDSAEGIPLATDDTNSPAVASDPPPDTGALVVTENDPATGDGRKATSSVGGGGEPQVPVNGQGDYSGKAVVGLPAAATIMGVTMPANLTVNLGTQSGTPAATPEKTAATEQVEVQGPAPTEQTPLLNPAERAKFRALLARRRQVNGS